MLSLSKHLPMPKNGRKILRLRYASLRMTAGSVQSDRGVNRFVMLRQIVVKVFADFSRIFLSSCIKEGNVVDVLCVYFDKLGQSCDVCGYDEQFIKACLSA